MDGPPRMHRPERSPNGLPPRSMWTESVCAFSKEKLIGRGDEWSFRPFFAAFMHHPGNRMFLRGWRVGSAEAGFLRAQINRQIPSESGLKPVRHLWPNRSPRFRRFCIEGRAGCLKNVALYGKSSPFSGNEGAGPWTIPARGRTTKIPTVTAAWDRWERKAKPRSRPKPRRGIKQAGFLVSGKALFFSGRGLTWGCSARTLDH